MADPSEAHKRAADLGRQAMREALHGRGERRERRDFTITKFSRHEDGYYHARVTPAGGTAIYVFDKWGSWMAPGEVNGNAVLKEVLPHVAAELADLRRKDQRRLKAEEAPDGGQQDDSSSVESDEQDADDGPDGR